MGFIFNGVTSQSMGINTKLASWQPLPPLRNNYVSVPGRPGVIDFGSTGAERIINVVCSIPPQRDFASFAGIVCVLDDLAAWLNPDNGLKQLVLDDVPDRYYMARLSEAVDCERLIRSAGNFTLSFVCPDPHAYAIDDETFVITNTGKHTVTRTKGNTVSEPVYYLRCCLQEPYQDSSYLSIITNGEELRIFPPLNRPPQPWENPGDVQTEILVIDTGKVTATVVSSQGAVLRSGLLHFDDFNFPRLAKGANDIRISVTPNFAEFTELRIQARSRWR